MICSLKHDDLIDLEMSRIRVISDSFRGVSKIIVCAQCHDAPCYYACPESAIEFNQSNGSVLINKERCNGCRSCEMACPYNAILFSFNDNKAYKCELCGGEPECVKWCPMNSLGVSIFGGELTQ
jgi:Fe-S-cluster-containing dehydrogenase component